MTKQQVIDILEAYKPSGVLCDNTGELMGWLYVPEVKLLEVLKGFV